MFFPVGDSHIEKGKKPFFTYLILFANILIFFYQLGLSATGHEYFTTSYAVIPAEILQGHHWISLLTSQFLHGGWMHLAGNMLFLWVFADNVEAVLGNTGFLLFYLAGGIIASLVHVFFHPYSFTPCVGASGAIAACMGAYLVMFPASRIRVMVLLFFFTFEVSALLFLGLWILLQFRSQLFSSGVSDIAYMAHIGGFLFGALLGLFNKHRIHRRNDGTYVSN